MNYILTDRTACTQLAVVVDMTAACGYMQYSCKYISVSVVEHMLHGCE